MNYERFNRQIPLPGFGLLGQQKLSEAKVLVIGAGGLGCPVLQYLASTGVGTLGMIDFDTVQLDNLNRQVLFGIADIGKLKAEVAANRLHSFYPDLQTKCYAKKLTPPLAVDIFPEYDVIVDASDNFATRYLVNDACLVFNKPLVYGAVYRFEGQVAVFNYQGSTNYRDVYPLPPKEGEIPNCADAGVLGILPGIIGLQQAAETIKIITGYGEIPVNTLFSYTFQNSRWDTWSISSKGHLSIHLNDFIIKDYEHSCSLSFNP